jgi:hypothetical protein
VRFAKHLFGVAVSIQRRRILAFQDNNGEGEKCKISWRFKSSVFRRRIIQKGRIIKDNIIIRQHAELVQSFGVLDGATTCVFDMSPLHHP